jgi:hypothetical protein
VKPAISPVQKEEPTKIGILKDFCTKAIESEVLVSLANAKKVG